MYKFLLCLRYTTTRYIGLVGILSVMIGVATMIVVNSVMGGFGEKMRERLHGILADVVVESRTMDGFDDPEAVMAHIRETCGDKIVTMTPMIEVFAMLNFQNKGQGPHMGRPVRLLGIKPEGRAQVGQFTEHLQNQQNKVDPSFELREDAIRWRKENFHRLPTNVSPPLGAIIGHQIASLRLKDDPEDQQVIAPGQEVIITTVTAGRPKPVDDRFVVVDVFKCDYSEYDSNYVFVPYERLQEIRGMGDAATSIQIKLKDFADAPEVIAKLQASLHPHYFSVATWEDKQGPLLQAIKIEKAILNIILFFIIAVAGFGILAVFTMVVIEKTKDIGIMKALGASNYGVMSLFLGFGLTLGVIGCVLGAVLGVTFTLNINPIEQALTEWTGHEVFPRDIYYFKDIPVRLEWFTVSWIVLGALFIAVAAAVLPARRAARLHPVEALRYE